VYAEWLDTLRLVAALAGVALAAVCGLLVWLRHCRRVCARKPIPAPALRYGRVTPKPLPDSAEVAFRPSQLVAHHAQAFAALAQTKGLHFTTAVSPGLPPAICADCSSIDLVLKILLDNAVKFTDEGAVRLEVAPETDAAVCWQVRFSVYDTGAGIDAELLHQLLRSDESAGSDSAHGLAVARRLVARMGGRLGAESEPRGGSTFWFSIPVTAVEPAAATPPSLCDSPLLLRAAHPGKRVLILDPDFAAQVAILWGVRTLGYYGEVVSCNSEALETWHRKPFDLVLVDCEMQNAAETVRGIRRLETGCIPIVAMNHHDGKTASISIDDRLAKPVCLLALARTLDHWLGDAAPVFASEASSDKLSLPV